MRYEGPQSGAVYREDMRRTTLEEFSEMARENRARRYRDPHTGGADGDISTDSSTGHKKNKRKTSLLGNLAGIICVISLLASIIFVIIGKRWWLLYSIDVFLISIATIMAAGYVGKNKAHTITIRVEASMAAIALIASGALLYMSDSGIYKVSSSMGLRIAGSLIATVALVIVITPLAFRIAFKRRCIEEGSARCVGFEDKEDWAGTEGHRRRFVATAPVYSLYYRGSDYKIYDDIYYEKEEKLPRLGETVNVRFDPENPEDCIIRGKQKPMFAQAFVAVVLMLFAGTFWALSMTDFSFAPPPKTLTDKHIADKLETDDFKVAYRTIKGKEGNVVFFEEYGGLSNSVTFSDASDYKIGEDVIYIEGNSVIYLFDADKNHYKGSHEVPNSTEYEDGRFILSDEYLTKYFGTKNYDIYLIVITDINNEGMTIKFDDETETVLDYASFPEFRYWNIYEGDELYLINSKFGFQVFSLKYNVVK